MAAMAKMYSGNFRQFAVRMPSMMWRLTSSSSTAGGDSKKPVLPTPPLVPKQEAADTSTYKVKEYYSYNEWSFYDLENVIDSAGRRQTQPDPKVKYTHTNPWTTNEKAAA
ncbi:hypothetical protein ACROYT_G016263 [Oculina patagonica]